MMFMRGGSPRITSSSSVYSLHVATLLSQFRSSTSSSFLNGTNRIKSSSSSYTASAFMGSATPFACRQLNRATLEALAPHPLTHTVPARLNDHLCIRMVKVLRWIADRFFRERFVHRAFMLKCVSSAPARAALSVEHIRSILAPKHRDRISKTNRLLYSAVECHEAHMKMILCVAQMNVAERIAVLVAQCVHYAVFAAIFSCSPRMGFRLMGYLLEESCVIMTHMINDMDMDKVVISNIVLPPLAWSFWGLESHFSLPTVAAAAPAESDAPVDGQQVNKSQGETEVLVSASTPSGSKSGEEDQLTLRDVVLLMRGDEMYYRDAHHAQANRIDSARDGAEGGGAPPTAFR